MPRETPRPAATTPPSFGSRPPTRASDPVGGAPVRSEPSTREPTRPAAKRGESSQASAGTGAPVRRVDRTGNLSSEERKRLMAEPAVKRAVELTGGSIVDVVRRGGGRDTDSMDDDTVDDVADDALAITDEADNGADDSALFDIEERDSGAN